MFDFSQADGLIFDCDGTLLDTLGAWARAEEPLFSAAGALTDEQEDEIHAAPIEKAAEILHTRYGVSDSAAAVLAHLDGELLPYYAEHAEQMPGAVDFVRSARAQGLPCVVLSSSPRRYLEAGLERAGILECFSALISTEEVGVSKQDPAIYEEALRLLGCERARCWAFDDAPYAVAVMREFGLKVVGVGAGASPVARLRLRDVADIYAESFSELLA